MQSSPKPLYKGSPHFQEFWSMGNAKNLIDWTSAEVSFNQFEKFAPYFYKVDELGDVVVKEIYFKNSFRYR